MTEQQKLRRILTSAAAQNAELHIVFGQRLARAVPIRGRFVMMEEHNLRVLLDVSAVDDAWHNEPCSAYFSVRCADLGGSYAFSTRMVSHKTQLGITHARLALPTSCTSRQVRRFERLAPQDGMVQRMAVWNLKNVDVDKLQQMGNPQHQAALRATSRMQEPPPLSALLPIHLQSLGPADFQFSPTSGQCQLVNVSAGGARLMVSNEHLKEGIYSDQDNLLILLSLSRHKQQPILLTLAGSCTSVLGATQGQDVRMRFIYWNGRNINEPATWAPVSLRGVIPLYEWVSQGLGLDESKPKGIETSFDMPRIITE